MVLYLISNLSSDNENLPELQEWPDFVFNLFIEIIYFLKSSIYSFLSNIDYVAFWTTVYMLWIGLKNVKYIKEKKKELLKSFRIKRKPKRVSVLIPARNEENNIKNCVKSLMNQSYTNYEILVMNDGSTDSTLKILQNLKKGYSNNEKTRNKLKYFSNEPLPSNWYGKSWAIQNLAKHADGDILMITDADTIHSRDSIKYCVHCLVQSKVDFVSGFPLQNLSSFGLKLIIPSMYLMSSYIVPLWLIEKTDQREFSLAIGQLMVIYKDVFNEVGGLSKVSNKICEDLQFARLLKSLNYRTLFVELEEHISTNMYDSFFKAFQGMGKNIFSAIDYSVVIYAFTTLIFGSILAPVISLITNPGWTMSTMINLLSMLMFGYSWNAVLVSHEMSGTIALFYPLMIVILFSISLYSTFITFFTKGHVWKGRLVN